MATNRYHILLGVVLSGAKSVWSSTVQLVWGLASFFLLLGLLAYYEVESSAIQGIFPLIVFIQQNWVYFWWIIFFFEFITSFKEFLGPQATQSEDEIKTKKKKEVSL